MDDLQSEGEMCQTCGAKAEHRTCAICGDEGWVIDCGHSAQADTGGHLICDDCADDAAVSADRRYQIGYAHACGYAD